MYFRILHEIQVFQPELDILGIAVYGTELTLWIGVFMCGGYFNLMPWLERSLSRRRQQQQEDDEQARPQGTSTGIALHPMPSSSSVFRTPSSILVEGETRG